jgi:uncharacterized protein (DUF1330 family)
MRNGDIFMGAFNAEQVMYNHFGYRTPIKNLYIARTNKITALDGTAPERFIAYAFDSVEKAQAFNNSPYMKEVNVIRDKTTQARSFIVEGMQQ